MQRDSFLCVMSHSTPSKRPGKHALYHRIDQVVLWMTMFQKENLKRSLQMTYLLFPFEHNFPLLPVSQFAFLNGQPCQGLYHSFNFGLYQVTIKFTNTIADSILCSPSLYLPRCLSSYHYVHMQVWNVHWSQFVMVGDLPLWKIFFYLICCTCVFQRVLYYDGVGEVWDTTPV